MIDKDLGFIIKRFNFRETSLLASIYTRKFGKIQGLFKGFYTNKKEFTSSLDIFTLNEFVLYPRKSEIWLISYADLIEGYDFLRKDIEKNSIAAVFVRVVDKCTAYSYANPEVFALLKYSLESLKGYGSSKLIYIFLIKFLTISGFKPEFNLCIECKRPYSDKIYFSVSSGGIICDKCRSKKNDAHLISLETSSTIRYIQHNGFPQILRINPGKTSEEEIIFILRKFSEYHLRIDPFPDMNISLRSYGSS